MDPTFWTDAVKQAPSLTVLTALSVYFISQMKVAAKVLADNDTANAKIMAEVIERNTDALTASNKNAGRIEYIIDRHTPSNGIART